ncbi:MAG TPA: HRDC domain-containing protein [Verrucomicrobiae bacterium]|nr:HRDC domain-containing protein [Verrucomicrobiae bacterium]
MIDTKEKLSAFLPVVKSAAWLAIDTEADSLHAYPEKVCLIQISTADGDRLVDPLADMDIAPLLDSLVGRELIFHAADYDLRLLRKHHDFTPSEIFDTMLASRLLGERQFGLGSLVEKFLGVKLDKGPQKADWAQRPLTPRMEEYARNDTRHLKTLEEKLRAELIAKGRLAWHQESCARLIAESSVPPVIDPDAVWRIKGSTFLERRALAVLRQLWHWRESEAVAASRPPFFVLSHETLIAICIAVAEQQPHEQLIPPRMHPRRRDNLAEAIRNAKMVPPEKFPQKILHRSQRPTEAEFRRFRDLEKIRDRHAHELQIDATLIAPKSVLGDLARDWDKHAPELMKWQRELLQPMK